MLSERLIPASCLRMLVRQEMGQGCCSLLLGVELSVCLRDPEDEGEQKEEKEERH